MANAMTFNIDQVIGLAIALALGLLIGIQRGWVNRKLDAGARVAGVRTYALVGLLGGVSGVLSPHYGPWLSGLLVLCLTLIMVAGYLASQTAKQNLSITGLIGMLLTFLFGMLATTGYWTLASCAAIVTTVILDNKEPIHAALAKLEKIELDAAIKLLLISVVMLSILPNKGYGPWQALNPYEIWWLVVLISSISFVGYFAVKLGGARRGLLFTGLFAGLSSSTALTMHFARLTKHNPEHRYLFASGILAACGTMFPRILLLCYLLNPALGKLLIVPSLVMTALIYLSSFLIWRQHQDPLSQAMELKQNPLELSTALIFGAILTLVIIAAHALREWFGSIGIYVLALISGLTDVDAITLTLARENGTVTLLEEASLAILLAALSNSLVKAALAAVLSGSTLLRLVTLPIVLALTAGIASLLIANLLAF